MDRTQQKQLTVFGYGLPLILVFLGMLRAFKHGWGIFSLIFFVTAGVVLILALLFRPWLAVIFKYWMIVAHGIGQVVTVIVLTFIFYLVFMPVGILLRVLGRDLLKRAQDPQALSYWIKRQKSEGDPMEYKRQF